MKRMWSKEELDKMIEQGGGGGDVTASDIDSEDATAGQVLQADGNGGSAWANINDVVADDIDSESATQGQVLTADGNGGATWQDASGGGGEIYAHNIKFYLDNSYNFFVAFTIYSKNSSAFTFNSLVQYFKDKMYYGAVRIMASGGYSGNAVCGISTIDDAQVAFNIFYVSNTSILNTSADSNSVYSFGDTVTQI